MRLLVIWCCLCAVCLAQECPVPVVGGYGLVQDGVCVVQYCNRGYGFHGPNDGTGYCAQCPTGTYSDDQTLDGCVDCTNKPPYASYKGVGMTSSYCTYACASGYYGDACRSVPAIIIVPVCIIIVMLAAVWTIRRAEMHRKRR